MRTIWQALAWKEWHEHKWKFVAILVILIACVALVLKYAESNLYSNLQVAILLPIIPLSMLIATSVATSERSNGTLPFLASLPVSKRKVAAVKLVYGLASCLIPVVLLLTVLYAWLLCRGLVDQNGQTIAAAARAFPGPFGMANWFLAVGSGVTLLVVSLFLWTAASGVNRADEISAAAVAMSVIGAIWLGLAGIGLSLTNDPFEKWIPQDQTGLTAVAFSVAPGGFALLDDVWSLGPQRAVAALIFFVVVHALLALLFVRRFGRISDRTARSRQAAVSTGGRIAWPLPPRRSWLTAIAWKQLRESGPVTLAGLGGVAAILAIYLLAWTRSRRDVEELRSAFVAAMFIGCIYLGGFTTLVVGIGLFLRDLSPSIHTFWRSRPISPQAWFWVKFGSGLAIVLLVFQLPVLICRFVPPSGQTEVFGGQPEWQRVQLIGIAAFVYVFSIAVAATCLLRNAVFATVLSLLSMYGGILLFVGAVFAYGWISANDRAADWLDGPQSTGIWVAVLLTESMLAATLGWLAIRYDWGRKSGY